MDSHEEKRNHQRYEHNSPMMLYRMDDQDRNYYAEMGDYSQRGLCLLTKEKLVLGQLVYLEMRNHDNSATGPEKYKSYSGRIRWSNTLSTNTEDDKGRYKYGVEYFESVKPKFH